MAAFMDGARAQAPRRSGGVRVGPVSAYLDRLKYEVWLATSISVWRSVRLPEFIHPRYTLRLLQAFMDWGKPTITRGQWEKGDNVKRGQ